MKPLVLIVIGYLLLRGTMYGFNIKTGVQGNLQPVMNRALDAVRDTFATYGLKQPTITSIRDGVHMQGSKHYEGLAFDIRLNDVTFSHEVLKQAIQRLCGSAFQVLHEYHGTEKDHLHIEYDPRITT